MFGDSAGGGLAAGAILKMRDEGLGMPAALVLWSPWTDVTGTGDTYFTLRNYDPFSMLTWTEAWPVHTLIHLIRRIHMFLPCMAISAVDFRQF